MDADSSNSVEDHQKSQQQPPEEYQNQFVEKPNVQLPSNTTSGKSSFYQSRQLSTIGTHSQTVYPSKSIPNSLK